MILGLLGLTVGVVVGAIGALMLVARTAAARSFVNRRVPALEPQKPTIHMRGHTPAWFRGFYCEKRGCPQVWIDREGWRTGPACYVDQDGRYWCEHHLPATTRVAERSAMHETKDGHCVIHDHKCPKPWEPY